MIKLEEGALQELRIYKSSAYFRINFSLMKKVREKKIRSQIHQRTLFKLNNNFVRTSYIIKEFWTRILFDIYFKFESENVCSIK